MPKKKKNNNIPKIKIGTDICQINRVQSVYKRYGGRFLGTGLRGVYFKEIEILRESSGAPKIVLHKRAKLKAKEKGLSSFEVSISHERDFAIAIVVGVGG